jgi:hypothetical protein
MACAWVRLKAPGCSLAFILLAGVCPRLAAAQQSPQSPASPAARLIVLPPKVLAGTQATLAVLDSQGRLLPNTVVELSDGQNVTTDATGRATFKTGVQPGTLVARVSGQGITAPTSVVAAEDTSQHAAPSGPLAGAKVVSYPHIVAIHDRFTLEGSGFRGAADLNHVYLADEPCLVLAASPLSLVALPGPRVPVGTVNLHVTVGGVDAGHFAIAAVLLEFSGPAEEVSAGSAGKLILHAHGTSEPLLLEIRNGSPGVIQLPKGNVQRLKTSGGDENIAPVEVRFVTGGNYSVSARLISADANQPDLQLARRRLAEARKIASSGWSARIDQVLLKIDQAPQDLPQIRAQLRSMLDDKPAAPIASLLDSAWRELN